MEAKRPIISPKTLSVLLSAAVLFPVFVYPLGRFIFQDGTSAWSNEGLWEWFSDHGLVDILVFTYSQAILSTLLSAGLGIWVAVLITENSKVWWARLLWSFSQVGFSLPAILYVLAYLSVWGRSGVIGSWLLGSFQEFNPYGWTGILVAHTFFNFPVFVRIVGLALLERNQQEEKAALSLGASRWIVFRTMTLRKGWAAIRESSALSFLYCSSSFLVVLLLGGGPRFTTIEVAIYESIKMNFDVGAASLLAGCHLLVFSLLYLSLSPSKRDVNRFSGEERMKLITFRPSIRRIHTVLMLFVVMMIAGLPLLTLVASILPHWNQLPWALIGWATSITVCLAVVSGVIATILSFCVAYLGYTTSSLKVRRMISLLSSLPVGISTILSSAALWHAYPRVVDHFAFSFFAIAVLQAIGSLPLLNRIFEVAFSRIAKSWRWTARSLGASEWQLLLTLEVPLMARSFLLALVWGVAFSLGEVGCVLVFLSDHMTTLGLEVFRMMGRYDFVGANVIGVWLLALMMVLYAVFARLEDEVQWRST